MKLTGIWGVIILALFISLMSTAAQAEQLRGGWVTAWDNGLFTAEQIDSTLAAAKQANLNALFVQVRKVGDAYYDSKIEPRGNNIAPDFDPLAYIIPRAHLMGIQIHAWVNVCRVWRSQVMPADPAHIVNAHQDWLNKTNTGQTYATEGVYLDPGVPAAREYTAALIEDIAKRYDLDGIHLDYIRYPGREWGYSDAALASYYAETNTSKKPGMDDDKWVQWKRDQVTVLAKMIHDRVHAAKPKIVVSAATIAWGVCKGDYCDTLPYSKVSQDWKKWLGEDIIDANVPMNYKAESNPKNAKEFREWLSGFKKWNGGKSVYVGIDIHSNSGEGVLSQINAIRKSGLDGYVLFSFNPSTRRDAVLKAMQQSASK